MGKVKVSISMSLDGYVAGPEQSKENPLGIGGEELHEWVVPLRAFREGHGQQGGEVNASTPIAEEILQLLGVDTQAEPPPIGWCVAHGQRHDTPDESLDTAPTPDDGELPALPGSAAGAGSIAGPVPGEDDPAPVLLEIEGAARAGSHAPAANSQHPAGAACLTGRAAGGARDGA